MENNDIVFFETPSFVHFYTFVTITYGEKWVWDDGDKPRFGVSSTFNLMKGRWKPLWYSTCIDKSLLIIIENGARDGAQMEHSNNASLIGINKHIRHLSINILKKNQKRLEREGEREWWHAMCCMFYGLLYMIGESGVSWRATLYCQDGLLHARHPGSLPQVKGQKDWRRKCRRKEGELQKKGESESDWDIQTYTYFPCYFEARRRISLVDRKKFFYFSSEWLFMYVCDFFSFLLFLYPLNSSGLPKLRFFSEPF